MKRIEIIFNQALEEDILESIKDIPEAQFYTIIPNVKGKGYSNPKMGDSVWPEFNELLFMYVENEIAVEKIKKAISIVQKKYPKEGLAVFSVST